MIVFEGFVLSSQNKAVLFKHMLAARVPKHGVGQHGAQSKRFKRIVQSKRLRARAIAAVFIFVPRKMNAQRRLALFQIDPLELDFADGLSV